ncbi:surface-adhesin E family protein [Brevundimonas sp.]|uniref:surface-adhesin E family protein n=1 Tax=Brevundimonas sp. TaxID=1871086 RepID=UPI00289BA5E4|nr:surface-adhesin E family protein [Brevundimonas sp.]
MTALNLALIIALTTPSWQDSINKDGWVQLRATDEIVMLLKKSSAPSSFWLRTEMPERSAMVLMRYDCAAWTLQIAQSFSYSQPNMTGDAVASSTVTAADVPPPNSLLDSLLKIACSN